MVSLIAIAVAGWLVTLLRQDYSDPAKRKTIGALWDVGTFWPRAVHPLAPPCYAERAIPEVVDRIRLLTGHISHDPNDVATLKYQAGLPDLDRTKGLTVPSGPLLLTGYSQGSVIAPAVVAQLPADVLPEVALLTLACPAQRLYGRAFPAYFGQRQLTELARLLDDGPDNPGAGRTCAAAATTSDRSSSPSQSPGWTRTTCATTSTSRAWIPPSWSRTRTRARRPPTATPSSGPTRAPPRSGSTWSSC